MRKISDSVRNTVFLAFSLVMVTTLMMMLLGKSYDGFAQCLNSKEVTMYGVPDSEDCELQKEKFGSSFKYINYVDCRKHGLDCKEVNEFPTWEFKDGGRTYGVHELSRLAELSGCKI
ncbi:MAG: hypothetical protein ABIH34_06540 [Nanoarchaeota archaeon]